jgi:hypothetical protein
LRSGAGSDPHSCDPTDGKQESYLNAVCCLIQCYYMLFLGVQKPTVATTSRATLCAACEMCDEHLVFVCRYGVFLKWGYPQIILN